MNHDSSMIMYAFVRRAAVGSKRGPDTVLGERGRGAPAALPRFLQAEGPSPSGVAEQARGRGGPPEQAMSTQPAGAAVTEGAAASTTAAVANAERRPPDNAPPWPWLPRAPWPSPVFVSFSRIRAPGTPSPMEDRIPPRIDHGVTVWVTGRTSLDPPVSVVVEASGADAGAATIGGGPVADITATEKLPLTGTRQTSPGAVDRIRLAAYMGGPFPIAFSNWFSIAALPSNHAIASFAPISGSRRGISVIPTWESDSGNKNDLDAVLIDEQLEFVTMTGCFKGRESQVAWGYLSWKGDSAVPDEHWWDADVLGAPGVSTQHQTHTFDDKRTGTSGLPLRNSGYVVTFLVTEGPSGIRWVSTEKTGTAVTANGVASGAATGTAFRVQQA
jgi:hypothetical protein